MKIYKCDCCKRVTEMVATISYDHSQFDNTPRGYWRDENGRMINQQGTRGGKEEYCSDCFRLMCWAVGNIRQGKYVPDNPVTGDKL